MISEDLRDKENDLFQSLRGALSEGFENPLYALFRIF